MRYAGRVALITGGSRGIGKAIALKLAEEGAKASIIDVNKDALAKVEQEFTDKNCDVFTKQADVTNSDEVEQVTKDIVDKFGSLDILVNNAGIIRDNLLFKMTNHDWEQVMNVHLRGAFNTSRAAQKHMVEQKYGRIINISSTSAQGNRGQANYSAAKAGLQGFTKALALELGKFGITTNSVAPGFIETEMTKETAKRLGVDFDQFINHVISNIPVARSGKPEDIANTVAFLADEASSFVNGQIIYVAGGPKD